MLKINCTFFYLQSGRKVAGGGLRAETWLWEKCVVWGIKCVPSPSQAYIFFRDWLCDCSKMREREKIARERESGRWIKNESFSWKFIICLRIDVSILNRSFVPSFKKYFIFKYSFSFWRPHIVTREYSLTSKGEASLYDWPPVSCT